MADYAYMNLPWTYAYLLVFIPNSLHWCRIYCSTAALTVQLSDSSSHGWPHAFMTNSLPICIISCLPFWLTFDMSTQHIKIAAHISNPCLMCLTPCPHECISEHQSDFLPKCRTVRLHLGPLVYIFISLSACLLCCPPIWSPLDSMPICLTPCPRVGHPAHLSDTQSTCLTLCLPVWYSAHLSDTLPTCMTPFPPVWHTVNL